MFDDSSKKKRKILVRQNRSEWEYFSGDDSNKDRRALYKNIVILPISEPNIKLNHIPMARMIFNFI